MKPWRKHTKFRWDLTFGPIILPDLCGRFWSRSFGIEGPYTHTEHRYPSGAPMWLGGMSWRPLKIFGGKVYMCKYCVGIWSQKKYHKRKG